MVGVRIKQTSLGLVFGLDRHSEIAPDLDGKGDLKSVWVRGNKEAGIVRLLSLGNSVS